MRRRCLVGARKLLPPHDAWAELDRESADDGPGLAYTVNQLPGRSGCPSR